MTTSIKDIISRMGDNIRMCGVVFSETAGEESNSHQGYMLSLPSQAIPANVESMYVTPDEWQAIFDQMDSIPVEAWVQYGDEKPAMSIVRKCERQINTNTNWAVYRRDNFCCRWCGNDQVPLSVDHLITWEMGGPSIEENLVSSCRKCNNVRGNMPLEEWLKCAEYKKRNKFLTEEQKFANIRLLTDISNIQVAPIRKKKRKR